MKIALAQLNSVVGDIKGNLRRIEEIWASCHAQQVDLLILPELFLTGYPPRDLLKRPAFLERVNEAIQEILKISVSYEKTGIILGAPTPTGRNIGNDLHNSALFILDGEILLTQHKSLLSPYNTFDETTYFEPSEMVAIAPFKGLRLGISIGEDIWNEPDLWAGSQYKGRDPVAEIARQGVDLLINIAATPYFINKAPVISRLISKQAEYVGVPFIYLNQVGANDELIFDGLSRLVAKDGKTVALLPAFQEEIRIVDTAKDAAIVVEHIADDMPYLYQALVMGIRDYLRKCGFSSAIIGLSGGIDSAVVAYLAVQALGRENVLGVAMPSPYSSPSSVEDAQHLADNLGMECQVIPIADLYKSYLTVLGNHFDGGEMDVAEENIQARIRGNILMALSNKYGSMVLTTGNKSEIAVGYCTLYGDMCGGLAVLADLPKTVVYELTAYINREAEVIPWSTVKKPPSAELRPNQVDQDTLPPYPILDAILNYYIEESLSADDIIARGYEPDTVRWVLKTVNKNEYKRRQAAPHLKVSTRAFAAARRMPIAARYDI